MMGADFVEKAAGTFKKSWDRGRLALATVDLFTQQPACASQTAAADIYRGAQLRVGESLIVEKNGSMLVAKRGLSEVAKFTRPSTELIQAIESSCGIGKGVVEQIHEAAGVAEISIC